MRLILALVPAAAAPPAATAIYGGNLAEVRPGGLIPNAAIL